MNNDEPDADEVEQNLICSHCIGESFLKSEVDRTGTEAECFYCEQTAKTFSIRELADYVDTAFEQHYLRTSTEPDGLEYLAVKEGGWWDRHGEPVSSVIGEAAKIDEDPAEHVRLVLEERHFDMDDARAGEENPFDEEAHYEESSVHDWEMQADWTRFQESLKTESRFFSRTAEAILQSIFENLDGHVTHGGNPVIVEAGPGHPIDGLFRARVFQSEPKLEAALKRPDLELGPPPPRLASAGRMNARGIAVFYGATAPEVALAETRPPVGSKAAVARFEIIRPLRLLDIEALRSLLVRGSVFDPSFIKQLEKAKFLGTLSHQITAPVMPDDELSEYLITQAIADYLAAQTKPSLDGIIYPSVQDGGNAKNVVLFHKSARVAELDIPPGTKIEAYTNMWDEDGRYPDYRVIENVPPKSATPTERGRTTLDEWYDDLRSTGSVGSGRPGSSDARDIALRIDLKSVTVHHIERATYTSQDYLVSRDRTEKSDREDY
jgi:hypothetical protein